MRTFAQIKKHSEKYAKIMRDIFPSSFEKEELNALLSTIVDDCDKDLFAERIDKDSFRLFIYSLMNEEVEDTHSTLSARELLSNVGYDFYVCKSPEDVRQFERYYRSNERICTFNDVKGRLSEYHIFWIIKKDIDLIPHGGSNMNRQDAYGTSCCSIQINKNDNRDISIKNRYNHSVSNCDATFSNNLDNIAQGLTYAINTEFGIQTEKKQKEYEVENFIFKNGKFMYYNYEINNIYYGINKVYKNGEYIYFDPNKYIIIDYYVINLEKKIIERIDNTLSDGVFDLQFEKIIVKSKGFDEDEDIKGTLVIYK